MPMSVFALNLVGYMRPLIPLRTVRLRGVAFVVLVVVLSLVRFRWYTVVLRRYTLFARSRTVAIFAVVTVCVLMLELTLVLTMLTERLLVRVLTACVSAAAPFELGSSTKPSRKAP